MARPCSIKLSIPPFGISVLRPVKHERRGRTMIKKKCVAMLLAGGKGSRLIL